MDFDPTPKIVALCERVQGFMDEHVLPIKKDYSAWFETAENKWTTPPLMKELKEKAQAEGLWNLFLPNPELGAGLSNLEYAPLAEIMGRPGGQLKYSAVMRLTQATWRRSIFMAQKLRNNAG